MVERSLSMREVPGSIPGASKILFHFNVFITLVVLQDVYRLMAEGIFLLHLQLIWDFLRRRNISVDRVLVFPRNICTILYCTKRRRYITHSSFVWV